MGEAFEIATSTAWTGLLFFAGVCCLFGVRRDSAPWWMFAGASCLVFFSWGGVSANDLVRMWSALPPKSHGWGAELLPPTGLLLKKLGVWLGRG